MRFALGLQVSLASLAAILGMSPLNAAAADTPPATPAPAASQAAPAPAAAPASAPAAAPAVEASTVIAKVNEVPITAGDLNRALRAMLSQSRMPAPTDPAQRQQIEAMALDTLIAQEVLYQAAKDVAIADLDQQVAAKIEAAKARLGTPEAFAQALAQTGITEEQFKVHLARDLKIGTYIQQEVDAKVTITPEQARQFYDQNQDKFKKPESLHASHILIGTDAGATPEAKAAAKQKADDLLAKIKGGADFAELAKAESTCPSAQKGGDLGSFGRGQMVKPFEEAAFSLQDGEVSGVVETQFGYHIIKSQGKTPSEIVPFEQVEARIMTQLKNQEVKKQLAAKVEALKQAAKVEMTPPTP